MDMWSENNTWGNHDKRGTKTWWESDGEDRDGPYLSHLDFPTSVGIELNAADYLVPDGIEKLLAFIRKRLDIHDLDLGTEAFDKYFNNMMRRKGDTLTKYINAEGTAYRKLQRVLKEAMEGWTDEYSDDGQLTPVPASKFSNYLNGCVVGCSWNGHTFHWKNTSAVWTWRKD